MSPLIIEDPNKFFARNQSYFYNFEAKFKDVDPNYSNNYNYPQSYKT